MRQSVDLDLTLINAGTVAWGGVAAMSRELLLHGVVTSARDHSVGLLAVKSGARVRSGLLPERAQHSS